ncbi:COP9 signalosome complex subunit 7 [Hibiscus syriacus]|uniref:COP9 signalosome complex subunit 7 n=1 Tax=Hibiscus syriacus TaxID=106335 RepID=A0A6A2Z1I3_HIBSY|nr:COP9 signalosome complex subunit 7 [Hibiscus syriacus]
MDIKQKQVEFIDHFVKQVSAQKGTTLVSVIVEATSHLSLFAFSEILALPTIAELVGTENSMYLEVLRLFAHGTWRDYKSNSGSLPQLVPDQVLKLKQLTVLTLAETNKVLPYDQLMLELDVTNVSELEDFLINECMYAIKFAAGRYLRPGQLGNWFSYLDMLPTTFGNPLWFTDDEMLELRGTILYRATELRKKDLIYVYEDKVKGLVKKLISLDGVSESEVCFEDFLWANSIFWSRALNLPLPHSYVFPQIQEDTETTCPIERSSEVTINHSGLSGEPVNEIDGKRFEGHENDKKSMEQFPHRKKKKLYGWRVFSLALTFATMVYLKAVATWEVPVPKLIAVGSKKEWKPKVISSNFGKGSGTSGAPDIPTSSVEANAHSQPVSRVLDYEEATSKLQKKLEELHLISYNLLVSSCDNLRTFLVFCFQIAIGLEFTFGASSDAAECIEYDGKPLVMDEMMTFLLSALSGMMEIGSGESLAKSLGNSTKAGALERRRPPITVGRGALAFFGWFLV